MLFLMLFSLNSFALDPYKCRPSQVFGGVNNSAVIHIGQKASCAVWYCNEYPQLAVVKTSAITEQMRSDITDNLANNPTTPLGTIKTKYAKDDVCSTLWDDWVNCRAGMKPEQVKAICPTK